MDSLPFDSMVDLYDQTRTVDRGCLASAIDWVCEQFPPSTFRRLFEPGIGTGRIAFPLAERGYDIVGVDISEAMLSLLRKRMEEHRLLGRIDAMLGDVTALPFLDASFDITVAVHLFYFIHDWQKAAREALRVTRPGGPVILIHTGTGEEVPFLNDQYKELCGKLGHRVPTVGAASTRDVVDYLGRIGCAVQNIRDRWGWTSRIRLSQAIGYMERRAYSFTTFAPEGVHVEAMRAIKNECVAKFGDLSTEIEIPNQVALVVLRPG